MLGDTATHLLLQYLSPGPTHCSYSGVQYDQEAVRIVLGDMVLMDKGQPLPFDEKAASAYLKGRADVHGTVFIQVGLLVGVGMVMRLMRRRQGYHHY